MVLPFFLCPFHRYYYKEECKRRDFMPVFSEDVARSLPPLFFCRRRYFPWKTNISLLTPFLQSHVSASMLERNVRAFRMSELCLLLDVSRMSSATLSIYTHGVFCVRKPPAATVAVNGALVWRLKHSCVVVVVAPLVVWPWRSTSVSFGVCFIRGRQPECQPARKILPLCERDFADGVFCGLVNSSQCGIV